MRKPPEDDERRRPLLRPRKPGGRFAALFPLFALACAPASTEPVWVHLARAPGIVETPPRAVRFDEPCPELPDALPELTPTAPGEPPGVWSTFQLAGDDWTPTNFPNTFAATTLLGPGQGRPGPQRSPYRLHQGAVALLDASELPDDTQVVPAFRVAGDRLFLTLAPGEAPPPAMRFSTFFAASESTEDGTRLRVDGATAEGFRVWPGAGTSLETPIPAGSSLFFGTVVRRALGLASPAVRIRVELDGVPLGVLPHEADDRCTVRWHELPLPEGARTRARLTWHLEGAPVVAGILTPLLGPRDHGRPAARPWGGSRPDLTIFLADTFRADNLGTYGSSEDLTPALDHFAERARVFEQAWSTSTWTLPSQASLLTGLYPPQHGAVSPRSRLPDGVVTLAEHLRARGYRTVAVTDAIFVSERYGLDQGFEVFLEEHLRPGHVDRRLEHVLAADDGRPLFVYFQTYRTHSPYHMSEDTRRLTEARWGPLRSHAELIAELTAFAWDRQGELPPHMAATLEEFRRLYLGGVRDLDRRFAEVLAALETEQRLEQGYLVFTSDHGETFGEHLELFHGNTLYEEEIRVPLLLHGPRFEAGREATPASLLDLPRTLAELAGLDPEPAWGGRSLLRSRLTEPVNAFGCFTQRRGEAHAVREGMRKLILPLSDDSEAEPRAFDLEQDPGERVDLLPRAPAWVNALEQRWRALAGERLAPAAAAIELELTPEEERRLEALGYG